MRMPVIVARCMVKRRGQGETWGEEFLSSLGFHVIYFHRIWKMIHHIFEKGCQRSIQHNKYIRVLSPGRKRWRMGYISDLISLSKT